ncbi:C40 family peptidase [Dendrosporobacter sp. 1207_IL3150]|uniref:C40 family peptidase n=1 Tax=Dendrosporobacter sp. 1207_IL3150 TaxID=3084054 RepID=UPI002FDAAEC8
MEKLIIAIAISLYFGGANIVSAAPPSGYNDFLQSLDSLITGAAIPIDDEVLINTRTITPQSIQVNQIVGFAQSMLGKPVVWGGASANLGFDCSGLVQYVYRQAGVNLPRTADLQFLVGVTISKTVLQPGDLVYFTTYEPGASHVGIYIGKNKFIHTSFSQGVVAISDMNEDYFAKRYYGSKRVL